MVRVRYSFGSRHTGHLENIKKQRKKFPTVADEVLAMSDIVLEVLDAKFIKETRNLEFEKKVKKKHKKIIYVLNKADTIDEEDRKNKFYFQPYVFVSCIDRKGGSELRNLIKKTVSQLNLNKKVFVGVFGYPNTGKSSLINYLIGKKSASVGNEGGVTKGLQKIKLSNDIFILDSPGVIPGGKYSMEDKKKIALHAILNSRNYSRVKNPEFIVQELLNDHQNSLDKYYNIESKGDVEILLEELGEQRKIFKKGGIVDTDKTARLIIKDWQENKIKI